MLPHIVTRLSIGLLIFTSSLGFAGCAVGNLFTRSERPVRFVGADYISYQSDGYRIYLADLSHQEPCTGSRQLDSLLSQGVLRGIDFVESYIAAGRTDARKTFPPLSADTVTSSHHDSLRADARSFNGHAFVIEMVTSVQDAPDSLHRKYVLYANAAQGMFWGPVHVFDLTIELSQSRGTCLSRLANARRRSFIYGGMIL